uniref:hypothetical protein n=1 Tax=uncultured Rikenella sp. TaxID=368003 RepID=UPI002615BE0E
PRASSAIPRGIAVLGEGDAKRRVGGAPRTNLTAKKPQPERDRHWVVLVPELLRPFRVAQA